MLHLRRSSLSSVFRSSTIKRSVIISSSSVAASAPSSLGHHQRTQKMSFHFASSEYTTSFQNLPIPDVPKLRKSAIEYIDTKFHEKDWYDHPVRLRFRRISIKKSLFVESSLFD